MIGAIVYVVDGLLKIVESVTKIVDGLIIIDGPIK